MYFTIFTPTYNRAYILPQLYKSLQNQNCFDFEWLIVDDGSSDMTEELVDKWINQEQKFDIFYYKTENGGKPRAINFGINHARGKFFLMIDSDDYILNDAVQKMKTWCAEIEDNSDYIGVGAARGTQNGHYIKGTPPLVNVGGFVDATNLERKYYNLDADMCEAYKTEIFKLYPMAEFTNEKFAPEQIALNEIALAGYKLRWHKDIVCICEYLDDGLTKGSFDLEKKNPIGYAMMYNHMLKYPDLTVKEKFKAACQHIALVLYSKRFHFIMKTADWRYTICALPVGILLAIRRMIQFNRGDH